MATEAKAIREMCEDWLPLRGSLVTNHSMILKMVKSPGYPHLGARCTGLYKMVSLLTDINKSLGKPALIDVASLKDASAAAKHGVDTAITTNCLFTLVGTIPKIKEKAEHKDSGCVQQIAVIHKASPCVCGVDSIPTEVKGRTWDRERTGARLEWGEKHLTPLAGPHRGAGGFRSGLLQLESLAVVSAWPCMVPRLFSCPKVLSLGSRRFGLVVRGLQQNIQGCMFSPSPVWPPGGAS